MNRKPLIFGIICFLILCLISLRAWQILPDLEQYPLHWNAAGEADRFGDKSDVAKSLVLFPAILLAMTALFHFMPKIEPLRKNLEQSRSAYNFVWMLMSAFTVLIGAVIASAYVLEDGKSLANSPRFIVIAISLLFIGIGNVLGKVRQNFMFGIRTPWTLSSELSWEKTHRLGARVFVAGGLVSILVAVLAPAYAHQVFMVSIIAIVTVSFAYSYIVWKADPDKRA